MAGINLQNLPSRNPNDLINSIRGVLVPPPGYILAVCDAAQIEARILSWIAGQEDLNEAFRQDRDIYSEFASKMSGRHIRKKRDTDPPALKRFYSRMRDLGKVGILGGGFGMGAEKCQLYAANTYHLDLPLTEAINLIQTYRRENQKITKFWRVIEQKFKAAARYHEAGEMERGLKFHYEADHDLVVITLPSTRRLHYKGVRVSLINGQEKIWLPDPMKGGKSREFIWGGVLTENVVQAMARDILAEGILATEAMGYRVALHAHDEIVAVVRKEDGDKAVKDICRTLSTPPAWAGDCPLGAEGKTAERYCK